eukprot:353394-Chlamydomonas_euryale.AAC.15
MKKADRGERRPWEALRPTTMCPERSTRDSATALLRWDLDAWWRQNTRYTARFSSIGHVRIARGWRCSQTNTTSMAAKFGEVPMPIHAGDFPS